MDKDQALDLARRAFASIDASVRAQTGQTAVAAAFDLASPALMKVVPAAWALVPLFRSLILPMIETALTPQEYDRIDVALRAIEAAMDEICSAARSERLRIEALPDVAIDQYLRDNNLIRG
jgi:hypothetical protein